MSTYSPSDLSIVFFLLTSFKNKEIYMILKAFNYNINTDIPFFSMLKELNSKEMTIRVHLGISDKH